MIDEGWLKRKIHTLILLAERLSLLADKAGYLEQADMADRMVREMRAILLRPLSNLHVQMDALGTILLVQDNLLEALNKHTTDMH